MHLFWLLITIADLASAYKRSTPQRHPLLRHRSPLQARSTHDSDNADSTRYAISTFEQCIDHDQPDQGTFSQRYAVDTTFWNGTGSPVVFVLSGEYSLEFTLGFYNESRSTPGLLASELGAALIILEHRYFGKSTVFDEWTTENLQHLTVKNAMQDAIHFSKTAQLSFSNVTTPSDVPWVAAGFSYPAALVAWIAQLYPDSFWAYYASSAIIEVVENNYGFFAVGEEVLPPNCTKDLQLIAAHIDEQLNGTAEQIHDIKALFGMETLEHSDDFASALQYGPTTYYSTEGQEFCDHIEGGLNATSGAPAGGIGLTNALANWAAYWKVEFNYPGYCDDQYAGWGIPNPCKGTASANTCCWDFHNPDYLPWHDTRPDNDYAGRAWNWIQCNEVGMYATGAPDNRPFLVSRLLSVEYEYAQCKLWFETGPNGETYGWAKGITPSDLNNITKGWNIDTEARIVLTSGKFDGFRYSTVVSPNRPGGPLQSSGNMRVFDAPKGIHSEDYFVESCGPGKDAPLNEVPCPLDQDAVRAQLRNFVGEWFAERGS